MNKRVPTIRRFSNRKIAKRMTEKKKEAPLSKKIGEEKGEGDGIRWKVGFVRPAPNFKAPFRKLRSLWDFSNDKLIRPFVDSSVVNEKRKEKKGERETKRKRKRERRKNRYRSGFMKISYRFQSASFSVLSVLVGPWLSFRASLTSKTFACCLVLRSISCTVGER